VSRPRVVVIGSVNVDVTVRADRLPGRGETVTGGTAHRGGGGKGANAAVAAARAGAQVELVAAVGDDEPGASALAELRAAGVGAGGVVALPDVATGTAVIVVDAAGDNQIAVASGANHALDAEHVEAALRRAAGEAATPGAASPVCDAQALEGAGAFLISFEIPDAAILAAARIAAAAGAALVVNPAPARPLPDGLAATRPILTPNQHEAAALTGEQDPERAARALAAATGAPVVVTLGPRGALVAEPGGATTLHPAPAVDALDATGAGDVFNGVLATALAAGAALPHAVGTAVAAAAASVTRAGAR
jgi:ribokinase